MAKLRTLLSALSAVTASAALAQTPAPSVPQPIAPPVPAARAPITPSPIDPPVIDAGGAAGSPLAPTPIAPPVTGVPGAPALPGAPTVPGAPAAPGALPADAGTPLETTESPNTPRTFEFQGEELALVLRALARQAKMNVFVSTKVVGTVTLRLENKTPREVVEAIVANNNLDMTEKGDIYNIRTLEEKAKEPAIPNSYTFSYATADKVALLLDKQLASGLPSQFDIRTNTVFFKESKSNMEKILLFLTTIDRPTQQVMIEARLVEVTANPLQAYGINWSGVFGSTSTPQTVNYGGAQIGPALTGAPTIPTSSGLYTPQSFLYGGGGQNSPGLGKALAGQFAILSIPAMSVTMQMLNEDSDVEFLANPRVVTANNQKAEIKIVRNQPVPQLNFNEQTAQAVFGGFQDKLYGNTLIVTPTINKDDFVTLVVKPEISDKVGDETFTFGGATVTSPIIDTRTLESNVVIKSGDTLAIGGLLQDEVTKARQKVPVFGDIPGIGYLFTQRQNNRQKRNLLVFVTPTIIQSGYGTGLEDQVSGLHHSGDEYADPNGWRNNAKGAIRLVPTSNRSVAADVPKPGVPPPPRRRGAPPTKVKSYKPDFNLPLTTPTPAPVEKKVGAL